MTTVSAYKNREGAWVVSAMLRDEMGEYYKDHTYYGYTKREAIALFRGVYGRQMVED